MAITLNQLEALLVEAFGEDFKYRVSPEQDLIFAGAATKVFRDRDGDNFLPIYIQLTEKGEYLSVIAPSAFNVSNLQKRAFLEACTMVQWMTKLIQFEYDHQDGEIRPVIEFPLEDNTLTARQLRRCVVGLVELLDTYYPFLIKAGSDGVIDLGIIEEARNGERIARLRAMAESMGISLEDLARASGGAKQRGNDEDTI